VGSSVEKIACSEVFKGPYEGQWLQATDDNSSKDYNSHERENDN